MIGGSPVYMPAMQYAPQPAYAVPLQQPRPTQAPAATTAPVYRGAMPKEQPRLQFAKALAPVRIPSPEELGVVRAKPIAPAAPVPTAALTLPVARREPPLDWAVVRHKLQDMGAVSFRLDQLPAGRTRFSIWMKATATPIQADGANEGEAVRQCVERAKTQLAMGK